MIQIPGISDHAVEAVVFDLGGVILDIDFHRSLAAFRELNLPELDAGDLLADNQTPFRNLELGLVSPEAFLVELRAHYPALAAASEQQIWEAWSAMLLPFERQRVELLCRLSEVRPIYLLSNTNLAHRIHFREMYAEQIGGYFDDLFIRCFYSDELHLRKPDGEIYRHVASQIGLPPEKLLFIDDHAANIAQARSEGWQAHHLTGNSRITDLFDC